MIGRMARWLTALALATAAGGCQQMAQSVGMHWERTPDGFWTLRADNPGEQAESGVTSKNPDERREEIQRLSAPERNSQDLVVELLATAVRQDPDPTVRSAAARALGASINPAAVPPLVEALEDPNEYVRLDAAEALASKRDDNAKRALLVRLGKDPAPQVRAASAKGLSIHHERRVVEALINALRDRSFVVVYNAEQSLIQMTGQTHEYDPDAWTRWLAGVGPEGDPFVLAGQTPPSLQASNPPLDERMRKALHRAWYWWQAEEKP